MPTPPFVYKLEFNYDNKAPADASVYIQMRENPPIYQDHIDKEDYDIRPSELKHPFLTTIFNIAGVTELSSKAYRLWLMKSPVYTWEEVLTPVLDYLRDYYHFDSIAELPGSAHVDGTGFTLDDPVNRRKI
jgi:hypothetical protein